MARTELTRRTFIKSTAATALGTLSAGVVTSAWAQSSLAFGTMNINVVSDGNLRLPVSFMMAAVPTSDYVPYFTEKNIPLEFFEPACNLTLVRDGERTILFDVGSGPNFMPTAGKITTALEAVGLEPADITHVVFTHAHPDHIWGILDDFDEPLFSEAEHMISKPEWDYWVDPDTVNTIGEARQSFAAGAKRNLMAVEDQITRFDFEAEILPGIRAIDTSGHTPGHAAFEIRSGTQSVVVVGDALTNQNFSFEKHFWPSASDQDQEKGISARSSLLDQLATDKMQIIAYHIPYPGIGRVERANGAYRFVAS